jgi:hypothetical protein
LPAGVVLNVTTRTETFAFYGQHGLAEDWGTGVPSPEGLRWVSACLLAHANAHSETIDILLMGEHEALKRAEPVTGLPAWAFQEAAFYGDLFETRPILPGEPYLHACVGDDTQRACRESSVDSLEYRVCARRVPGGPDCRFEVVGGCNDRSTVALDACGPYGSAYDDCDVVPHGRLSPDPYPLSEVITVHLYDSRAAGDMHPKCSAVKSAGECTHDICQLGPPLKADCHSCVAEVCAADAYCCTTAWDNQCVAEVGSICGTPCAAPEHSVCEHGLPLDVYGSPEANLVCSVDPFCCDVMWDEACVTGAEDLGFCP